MTITTGPNLGVMEDGAAGDVHVTEFKAFLRAMDFLVQCNVISATTIAQPGSPANGDAYLVPAGATGAVFSANIGKLVRWTTKSTVAQWDVFTPKEGWECRAKDTDVRYEHNGTVWVAQSPAGSSNGFKNYLINPDLLINQRVFAGGALVAGVYGYDRWKAGTGGCNVTVNVSTSVITHTSGPLVQIIEAPGLASKVIAVSVEDPSGSITVNVDGQTGTITTGVGRRGVTITVPAGSTGNVTLTLTATGVTYKRVQMELGTSPTVFEWRPITIENILCERYFQTSRTYASGGYWTGQVTNTAQYAAPRPFATLMRIAPTVTLNNQVGVSIDPLTIAVIDADVAGFRFIGTANATGAGTILTQFKADAEL